MHSASIRPLGTADGGWISRIDRRLVVVQQPRPDGLRGLLLGLQDWMNELIQGCHARPAQGVALYWDMLNRQR